ncbi:Immunoglobulin domain containing protein [Aphelenchoides besseyi]|nr:Immunoglobulin domain containing protein [Aphelenchoides besseyi]
MIGTSTNALNRLIFLFLVSVVLIHLVESRGGRRGGKGKGKSNLQFAQVAEFSLIQKKLTDNRSAHIITGSHFSQIFRLGYKLVLICRARGEPRPMIKWFKEGSELPPKANTHYYEQPIGKEEIWSKVSGQMVNRTNKFKLEIDPATMNDQGIYACVANNQHGVMAKNFKAEYTY